MTLGMPFSGFQSYFRITLIAATPSERAALYCMVFLVIQFYPLLNYYIFLTLVSKSITRATQFDIPNFFRESGNIKCHLI